jgi:NAD(P)-dependent dehydrogenase (short-subunit alcohol dehydrogenase family)
MDMTGRHVVVTGGTGALGGAVVGSLLTAGAYCRVSSRHKTTPESFAYRHHDRVTMIEDCELSDETAVARLYEGLPSLWASIHLAGGFAAAPVVDTDKTGLTEQLDSNLVSCVLCCRAAVQQMAKTGGRIVNIAARPALEWRSGAGMAAYTAAKAAVAAFTVALAQEVAEDGILVNAVAPSIMDTPANRQAMPIADASRWPSVEDVASTIVFLASPANRATRGAIVPVYGNS